MEYWQIPVIAIGVLLFIWALAWAVKNQDEELAYFTERLRIHDEEMEECASRLPMNQQQPKKPNPVHHINEQYTRPARSIKIR